MSSTRDELRPQGRPALVVPSESASHTEGSRAACCAHSLRRATREAGSCVGSICCLSFREPFAAARGCAVWRDATIASIGRPSCYGRCGYSSQPCCPHFHGRGHDFERPVCWNNMHRATRTQCSHATSTASRSLGPEAKMRSPARARQAARMRHLASPTVQT